VTNRKTDAEKLQRAIRRVQKLSEPFVNSDDQSPMSFGVKELLGKVLDSGILINCRIMRALKHDRRQRRRKQKRLYEGPEIPGLSGDQSK